MTTADGNDVSGTNTVVEGSTGTLFTLVATGQSSTVWGFKTGGNSGNIAEATITNGAVVLASGKTLDYETTKTYEIIVT